MVIDFFKLFRDQKTEDGNLPTSVIRPVVNITSDTQSLNKDLPPLSSQREQTCDVTHQLEALKSKCRNFEDTVIFVCLYQC